jgi:hypothetical protein
MSSVLNLLGYEGYFALPMFWVRYEPDPRTGCLPAAMRYARWQVQPPPTAGWDVQAERRIAELEGCQQRGDLDSISENLPRLAELAARLEQQAERFKSLAERAHAITARHEPSAGKRGGM